MILIQRLLFISLIFISQSSLALTEHLPTFEIKSQKSALHLLNESKICFYFLDGITKTGVVKDLDPSKEYTFFVPTDDAFEQISLNLAEDFESNLNEYKRILKYHIAEGTLIHELTLNGHQITTLEGSKVRVEIKEQDVYINETKVIGKAFAEKGTIYFLESILIP